MEYIQQQGEEVWEYCADRAFKAVAEVTLYGNVKRQSYILYVLSYAAAVKTLTDVSGVSVMNTPESLSQ